MHRSTFTFIVIEISVRPTIPSIRELVKDFMGYWQWLLSCRFHTIYLLNSLIQLEDGHTM
jgi:hypothetical protein